MIPVDNTLAGRVADVHHLIPEGDLYIIGEHFQLIRHCLLGIPGAKLEELTDVHSHVHAIPQCKKIVDKNFNVARFYADVEGHIDESSLQLAFEELRFFAKRVVLLGTYPAHAFRSMTTD